MLKKNKKHKTNTSDFEKNSQNEGDLRVDPAKMNYEFAANPLDSCDACDSCKEKYTCEDELTEAEKEE